MSIYTDKIIMRLFVPLIQISEGTNNLLELFVEGFIRVDVLCVDNGILPIVQRKGGV